MQVKEIMTQKLDRIESDATIANAARIMKQDDVGCLAVMDNGRIVGTLTDRDIVIRATAEDRDPDTITVKEAMSAEPVSCKAEDTLETAARHMQERKIRRLIVRDENEVPVGMVSLGDIAARAHSAQLSGSVMEKVCEGC